MACHVDTAPYNNELADTSSSDTKSLVDPATHLAVERALAPFRTQGIVIIGSGLSYHNLRRFGPAGFSVSREFDDWLA